MPMQAKKVIPTEKKKPGRKPTGRDPLMAFRVPPRIRARIQKLAEQKGFSLSKAIVWVLDKHLPKGDD